MPIALIFPCDFDLAYLSYSLLLYVSSISTIKKGKRDKVSIYIVTYYKIWVTTTDSTVCPRSIAHLYIVNYYINVSRLPGQIVDQLLEAFNLVLSIASNGVDCG